MCIVCHGHSSIKEPNASAPWGRARSSLLASVNIDTVCRKSLSYLSLPGCSVLKNDTLRRLPLPRLVNPAPLFSCVQQHLCVTYTLGSWLLPLSRRPSPHTPSFSICPCVCTFCFLVAKVMATPGAVQGFGI